MFDYEITVHARVGPVWDMRGGDVCTFRRSCDPDTMRLIVARLREGFRAPDYGVRVWIVTEDHSELEGV